MTRRLGVLGIVASTLLIAAAYGAALLPGPTPAWAPWCYMVGTATVMLATIVLGAARSAGGVGRLAVPFVLIYVLLLVGFGAALALPPEAGPDAPLWLGLPRRAAIVIYGIGVVPLFLLPVAYALTFDTATLREADLARIAAARAARLEALGSRLSAIGSDVAQEPPQGAGVGAR